MIISNLVFDVVVVVIVVVVVVVVVVVLFIQSVQKPHPMSELSDHNCHQHLLQLPSLSG